MELTKYTKENLEHLIKLYTIALNKYGKYKIDTFFGAGLCKFYHTLRINDIIDYADENILDDDIDEPNEKALSLMDTPKRRYKWELGTPNAKEKRTAFLKGMLDYYKDILTTF